MADHQKLGEEQTKPTTGPLDSVESEKHKNKNDLNITNTPEEELKKTTTLIQPVEKHDKPIEQKQSVSSTVLTPGAPHLLGQGNEEKLKVLVEMGFDANLARKALEQTEDIEEAANLIMIIQENGEGNIRAPTKDAVKELRYKMVIVVRGDLKMTPGKVAAQVGHAVLAAYKLALAETPKDVHAWEEIGQMKAVVRCDSQKELMEVYNNARKSGLVAEYIQDAGRTQVEPGSVTVCAVGPARSEFVDQVTGHLKLY